MSRQLTFALPVRAAMGRDEFFVSPANAAAVAGVEAWADWPGAKMVLTGDEGAGKTHLAHVWAAMSGAEVIAASDLSGRTGALVDAPALAVEDVDRIAGDGAAEEALFHLHNAMAARNAPLLLTGRAPPVRWGLTLPDLASRVAQAGLLRLDPPDDQLLSAVMLKQAADRGLKLSPSVLGYILPRMGRSFADAADIIARLDALALAEKRPPTRRMAEAVLSSGPAS
ncbi:chromosomal replication initiator DnaA [Rhodobacterales bacterium HKCCE3408]|nr:chromosomal replication initiator DnaA [Rhodobacterales bacterium HKCCE3408]